MTFDVWCHFHRLCLSLSEDWQFKTKCKWNPSPLCHWQAMAGVSLTGVIPPFLYNDFSCSFWAFYLWHLPPVTSRFLLWPVFWKLYYFWSAYFSEGRVGEEWPVGIAFFIRSTMDYRRRCLCPDLKRKALMGIREIHPYTFKSKFLSNKEVVARFSDCYKSLNFVSLGFVSCGNRLKPPLAISKITMLFGTKGRTCGSNHWCFLI